ncbi:type II secretion system protein [Henriciella sp.]|uniref:type IV pilus modification PilV family protein n=1 Tax=Henriciella sp. TaxID=1968823 RepID=UPI002624F9DB|nr:type II secretion system protein [Henriciella sp.]
MRRGRAGEQGFTLMETLVAFAVFSLSMVALMQSYASSSRSQARSEASLESAGLLSDLLATVEVRLDAPGVTSGETREGFEWTLSIEPAGSGLLKIRAVVRDPYGRVTEAQTLRWHDELYPEERTG